ncbi:hypothetical protein ACNKHL_09750 [Shigella flexneri]
MAFDPQKRLKNGEHLPQEDWGYDMRDGVPAWKVRNMSRRNAADSAWELSGLLCGYW